MGNLGDWKTTIPGIAVIFLVFLLKIGAIRFPSYHEPFDWAQDSIGTVAGIGLILSRSGSK